MHDGMKLFFLFLKLLQMCLWRLTSKFRRAAWLVYRVVLLEVGGKMPCIRCRGAFVGYQMVVKLSVVQQLAANELCRMHCTSYRYISCSLDSGALRTDHHDVVKHREEAMFCTRIQVLF
jgi:hypothetical protein